MADYRALAKEARLEVLKMVHEAKTSHIASNFSIIDVATVLYENLKNDSEIVWSKGWAAASIYYFLCKKGVLTKEQIKQFPNSPFFGLAETTVPGVHVSGGSMGHGLPVAVGMALAKKLSNEPGMIYCIMSDGEMNEGTTWESAMVAAHHQLNNLCVIVDKNNWQAMGKTNDVLDLGDLKSKWTSFNFETEHIDGHNFKEIESTVLKADKCSRPMAIIAETVKGKGVSFFENHLLFHYKHVDKNEYEKAVEEISRDVAYL